MNVDNRRYSCTDCDGCGNITLVDCDTGFCKNCDSNGDYLYESKPSNANKYSSFSNNENLEMREGFKTQVRGTNSQEYSTYLSCSDERPLKSFDVWMRG